MKEGLTRQIRFRVDAGSYEKLRRDAGRQGLSVSDYLRSLVMDPPDVGRCGLPLADERRSERVRVSLTPAEGAWLRERAGWLGCGVGEAARRLIFARADFAPVVIDTALLHKTYFELNRQGNNLNQLMTYLNTYRSKADTSAVADTLAKVYAALDELEGVTDDLKERMAVAGKRDPA